MTPIEAEWPGHALGLSGIVTAEGDAVAQCAICAYLRRMAEVGQGSRLVHVRDPSVYAKGLCEMHLMWLGLEVAELLDVSEDDVTIEQALEVAHQVLPLAA